MLTLDGLYIQQGDFSLSANWAVPVGARVALVGPSGAGKSTLLLAIAGFLPLKAGRIFFGRARISPTLPRVTAPLAFCSKIKICSRI